MNAVLARAGGMVAVVCCIIVMDCGSLQLNLIDNIYGMMCCWSLEIQRLYAHAQDFPFV